MDGDDSNYSSPVMGTATSEGQTHNDMMTISAIVTSLASGLVNVLNILKVWLE